MGSVCAMNSTNRLSQVLAEKGMDILGAQLVGRRIVGVKLDGDDSYEIRLSLVLDNGKEIDGGKLAEYTDPADEDTVDSCVIFSACPLDVDEIRAEYKRRGWDDRL